MTKSTRDEHPSAGITEKSICGHPTVHDRQMYQPQPKMMNLWNWLPTFANRPDATILEVRSREVANKSRVRETLPLAQHIGVDLYHGPTVDITGDIHDLSGLVPPNSVDVIISFAVFEHLAMPWVVAHKYSTCLKVGGVAGTFTHFSFSEHELPWHFFQFNNHGLEALFNPCLGFETIESGKGMPMVGRFAYDCKPELAGKPIKNLYCSSYLITKKIKQMRNDFSWKSALADVLAETEYPKNTGMHRE